MIDAVIREIIADIDYYDATLGSDPTVCLAMSHVLRWRTGLRAVLDMIVAHESPVVSPATTEGE